jgi:hypothetical protein
MSFATATQHSQLTFTNDTLMHAVNNLVVRVVTLSQVCCIDHRSQCCYTEKLGQQLFLGAPERAVPNLATDIFISPKKCMVYFLKTATSNWEALQLWVLDIP